MPITTAKDLVKASLGQGHCGGDLLSLPAEVLTDILARLSVRDLLALSSKLPELAAILQCPRIWRNKSVRISTSADFEFYYSQRNYIRHVARADFGGSCLLHREYRLIPTMFDALSRISFDTCLDIDDTIIEMVTFKYGNTLRGLSLHGCQNLTNMSLECISMYCRRLTSLNLNRCMLSNSGLGILASSTHLRRSLRSMHLAHTYLLTADFCTSILPEFDHLRRIDINGNTSYDMIHMRRIIEKMPRLRNISMAGCDRFTRQDIARLQAISKGLFISHSAELEDDSTEAIRQYVLELISRPVVSY